MVHHLVKANSSNKHALYTYTVCRAIYFKECHGRPLPLWKVGCSNTDCTKTIFQY